jgi:hypothetical protein
MESVNMRGRTPRTNTLTGRIRGSYTTISQLATEGHIGELKPRTLAGKPIPFGATLTARGTQFAVFSRNATAVSLLLFSNPQDAAPAAEI